MEEKETTFEKWHTYDIIGIGLSFITILINFLQIYEMINKNTNEGMSLLQLIFTTLTLFAWSIYHTLLASYATAIMTIFITFQFIGMIGIKIWKNRKEKIMNSFQKKMLDKLDSI